ncbi:MAG TPA: metallophosphoesterase [Rhodopila sp.]|nr:metallophosphoesterase [Rhodopila sp.]
MRTVVHISDLHFGRVRPDLVAPLLESIRAAQPDLVVVSGDLTQRARNWQFAAARHFLATLPQPLLVIPGNHDIPLDLAWMRLLAPWARYRRWVGRDLEPCFQDEEIVAVGLNTVAPFLWERGWIADRAVTRASARFGPADGRMRIVITHHPFVHAPQATRKPLMLGAAPAVRALARGGADIILSGHLHTGRAEAYCAATGEAGSVLLVQAGTGLSTRTRGQGNDYNVLRIDNGAVAIARFAMSDARQSFHCVEETRFIRQNGAWMLADPLAGPGRPAMPDDDTRMA